MSITSAIKALEPKNDYIASLSSFDLALLGQDILVWKHTGLLPKDSELTKVEKEIIKNLNLTDPSSSMRITETMVMDEIVRRFCIEIAPYEPECPLQVNQDIWYINEDNPTPEHGVIFSISYNKDGTLDSFSINFDNGDFDEFLGSAYLKYFFDTKEDAELRYRTLHTYNEY